MIVNVKGLLVRNIFSHHDGHFNIRNTLIFDGGINVPTNLSLILSQCYEASALLPPAVTEILQIVIEDTLSHVLSV